MNNFAVEWTPFLVRSTNLVHDDDQAKIVGMNRRRDHRTSLAHVRAGLKTLARFPNSANYSKPTVFTML